MPIDISHLNPEQQQAIRQTEGPLLVLAGAGSGKTTVLINRIAQILSQGTPPWAVLAITFTNKAAKEMKERLARLLGEEGSRVWASTFHSLCVRILRAEIEALGYARGFTIYDTDDQKRLMKAVMKDLNVDDKRIAVGAVLSAISKAKDDRQTPADFAKRTHGDYYLEQISKCFDLYSRRLRECNAVDFDDLILLTVRLFQEHPTVLAHYQRKFRYVLVDEYQDTNRLQFELVQMLASGHNNLCVVGDDDQSIYRFRGATIENILQFEEQFPGTLVIRLEQNYRSTGAILDAANAVIAHNRGRKGKTLWTSQPGGDEVSFFKGYNENDEARFIADTIMDSVKNGRRFSDFCILYRMNALSARIESSLRMTGVPYRILGGLRFYDRAEVRDMLAYLQMIRNSDDNLRLQRIINTPARDLGAKTVAAVAALAARDHVPMFSVLRGALQYTELGRKAVKLKAFADMLDALSAELEHMSLPVFYDVLLERTGYRAMLEASNDPDAENRLQNILELKSQLAHYQESDPDATLAGFLDEVALLSDVDGYEENDDTVVLMTIHSAKGLEFPVVFIVGAEENLLPSYRSIEDPSELEEERRLCYVAATRARQKLYVTCAQERMQYGKTGYNPVSRFVEEMKLVPDRADRAAKALAAAEARRPAARASRVGAAPPGQAFSVGLSGTSQLLALNKGEMVTHKAFGRGMVLSLLPMAGDALVEIAFDDVGTKKLMLKSAQTFLRKE